MKKEIIIKVQEIIETIAVAYEESRGSQNNSSSGRDYGGYRLKEAHWSNRKDLDGQKLANEEKKKHDDGDTNRDKDRYYRADKYDFASEKQEIPTKKQKFSNWDKGADYVKDAATKMSLSSMQAQYIGGAEVLAQAHASDSVANDLDAAKVAAIRAAELVLKQFLVFCLDTLTSSEPIALMWSIWRARISLLFQHSEFDTHQILARTESLCLSAGILRQQEGQLLFKDPKAKTDNWLPPPCSWFKV